MLCLLNLFCFCIYIYIYQTYKILNLYACKKVVTIITTNIKMDDFRNKFLSISILICGFFETAALKKERILCKKSEKWRVANFIKLDELVSTSRIHAMSNCELPRKS